MRALICFLVCFAVFGRAMAEIENSPGREFHGVQFAFQFTSNSSKWGPGISDEAQIYVDICDAKTIHRVYQLEVNQLYAVVEKNHRFVTSSYQSGSRVLLESQPLASGAIVPGWKIGKRGVDANSSFRFVLEGNGFRFDLLEPASAPPAQKELSPPKRTPAAEPTVKSGAQIRSAKPKTSRVKAKTRSGLE